jgi:hypothetical protein
LSALPVFIDGVERWLIDLTTSVTLQPDHIESGTDVVGQTLEIAYRGSRSLSGSVRLEGPASVELSPRHFTVNLTPDRTESLAFTARYPHNEPAGRKRFLVHITFDQESYELEVPLSAELGLSDVHVWGMAVADGADLVLRHVVSNRAAKVVNFRGSAAVPGRERQYRPFTHLRPGDTQSVEYRFAGGAGLVGRTVLLGLREMNDGPRVHALELVVP